MYLLSLTATQATNFNICANIHVFGGMFYGGSNLAAVGKMKWFTGSRTLDELFRENPWVSRQLLQKLHAAMM